VVSTAASNTARFAVEDLRGIAINKLLKAYIALCGHANDVPKSVTKFVDDFFLGLAKRFIPAPNLLEFALGLAGLTKAKGAIIDSDEAAGAAFRIKAGLFCNKLIFVRSHGWPP
jgi:hypothetical protein